MNTSQYASPPSPPSPVDVKSSVDEKDGGLAVETATVDHGVDFAATEALEEAAIEAAGQEDGTSWYIWKLALISAVSGTLFGYDTGAINSVLVQIGTSIDNKVLSSGEKELITSALSVGAILGSAIVGYLSDKLGRKRTLIWCDLMFIVGAVIQATIHNKWPFVIGRFIMGIGVGSASMIAPVFISEIAPVRVRGKLVTLNSVAITGGQVIATVIGVAFENVSSGWRWIIALGAIPPLLQGIAIEIMFPESPRHLQKIGKTEQAGKVLARMYPKASEEQIEAKVDLLQRHIAGDNKTVFQKFGDLLRVPTLRRAAFISALMLTAQQLCGFNSLMYYSATIFSQAGLTNTTATSLVVSGVNWLMTIVGLFFLDRFGRRNFLKFTIPFMIFGLLFATVVFYYMTAPTDHLFKDDYEYNHALSSVMILSMVIFVASYAAGLGHIPWSTGDFYDQAHRGVGASVGSFFCWSFNLVVSSTFLRLMESITPAGTFGFYAALSFFFAVILYFTYPETLSLSLEQARMTLEGGFRVKESMQWRRQNVKMLREKKRMGGSA